MREFYTQRSYHIEWTISRIIFTIQFFFHKQCFLSIYIRYFKRFLVFAKIIMVIVFQVYLSPYKKYARLVYLSLLIWSLSERKGNRTHTHLIHKQAVYHLPKLPNTVSKLSKYGFFSGSNFPVFEVNTKKYGLEKTQYFRHFSCSANVSAKTRVWYDKSIKSNVLYK